MSEKRCSTCKYLDKSDLCDDCTDHDLWKSSNPADALYALADLEQARRRGAEDERGRCMEIARKEIDRALRLASEYKVSIGFEEIQAEKIMKEIRSLGPIGETREETERRVRRETVEKMSVYIARADLLQFKDEIDAIAEGGS